MLRITLEVIGQESRKQVGEIRIVNKGAVDKDNNYKYSYDINYVDMKGNSYHSVASSTLFRSVNPLTFLYHFLSMLRDKKEIE